MTSSINTNISAYFAQANIAKASSAASTSVSRLSSGNFITKASDDVARLSIGTSFSTTVRSLRQALSNASQGISLLQVADGALGQVTEILQRQKTLAVQASSGNLSATDRGFLNQEFQALTKQIDFIASTASFNGVKLLDGGLSEASVVSAVDTQATKGSSSITFTDAILSGESVVIGDVVMIAGSSNSGVTFEVGGTLEQSVENLAARLNALAATVSYANTLGNATYAASGNTLTITANAGGSLSNNFTVKTAQQSALAASAIVTGAAGANTTLTITVGSNHGFVAGQSVSLAGQTAAIDGVTAAEINTTFTIDSVTSTTIVVTSAGTATSGATTGGTAGVTVTANLANIQNTEAYTSGGYGGSQFSLLATGLSSATDAVSADTAASATPFQNGDSITAQIAGGTSKTLMTLTDGAGTANSSGDYSLTDIINGINANTGTTGYKAALTYNGSTYNIRLSYDTLQSNVIVNLGTNYNSTTYGLNGTTIDSSNIVDGAGASARNRAIFNTGYVDLLAASIGAVTSSATVIGTSATAPFVVGDSILATVNGVTHNLHTFVAADGFDDIISSINSKTATTGIYAAITGAAGNVDNIRLFLTEPGVAGSKIALTYSGTVGNSAGDFSTATKATTSSATITQTAVFGLDGGADDGLGKGSVSVSGDTNGDTILTDLAQIKANVSVLLTQNAVAADNITVGGQAFYFVTAATAPNQITIGADLKETLDNAVEVLNNYFEDTALADTAYQMNQMVITREDDSLVFTSKGLSDITKLNGTAATISQSITGASITNSGNLDNASSTYGVDITGVTNADFIGTISGFNVTYTGTTDTADISVKVGDFTYTAESVDLTLSTDTRVRLYSDTVDGKTGGYFDIQLDNGQVATFSSQAAADTIATRLDSAFSNLVFNQKRILSSYVGGGAIISDNVNIGSLVGTSVSAQLGNFDDLSITDVSVASPEGSAVDAKITLTVGGVKFSTGNDLGDSLGARQTYRLTSEEDPNHFIEFTTGDASIDLSSAANALAVRDALKDAFGVVEGSAALSFQIGTKASESLAVSISAVGTDSLFEGATLSIATLDDAAAASDAIDAALATVTSIRANVGALQSRFNFASANIQISVQNQDASRSELLDTDIAAESTSYATAQVQLQAGISVLAQANQQLQSLLKLLG